MNFTFSLCDYFYSMSIEHYNIYIDSKKKTNDLSNNNNYYDVLSHSPEENLLFQQYYYKGHSSAIASIVFQAFAVESFINYYGSKKLGKNMFHDHYDRIGIIDKIIIIPKIATGKDFPKGEKVFELIKKLFSKRDKLVHHKGKEINFGDCNEDIFQSIMHHNIEFIFEDIENIVNTYPLFIKTLAKLEGKEIDLYSEQQAELEKEFQKTLIDTFKQIFQTE